jgi:hypothetical protein
MSWRAQVLCVVAFAAASASCSPLGQNCRFSAECPDGYRCTADVGIRGRCQRACELDRDCPAGVRCVRTRDDVLEGIIGYCNELGTVGDGGPCESTLSCAAGLACAAEESVRRKTYAPGCNLDAPALADRMCVDGMVCDVAGVRFDTRTGWCQAPCDPSRTDQCGADRTCVRWVSPGIGVVATCVNAIQLAYRCEPPCALGEVCVENRCQSPAEAPPLPIDYWPVPLTEPTQ